MTPSYGGTRTCCTVPESSCLNEQIAFRTEILAKTQTNIVFKYNLKQQIHLIIAACILILVFVILCFYRLLYHSMCIL